MVKLYKTFLYHEYKWLQKKRSDTLTLLRFFFNGFSYVFIDIYLSEIQFLQKIEINTILKLNRRDSLFQKKYKQNIKLVWNNIDLKQFLPKVKHYRHLIMYFYFNFIYLLFFIIMCNNDAIKTFYYLTSGILLVCAPYETYYMFFKHCYSDAVRCITFTSCCNFFYICKNIYLLC